MPRSRSSKPGDRHRVGTRRDREPCGRTRDRVAVAHPHDLVDGQFAEQQRRTFDVKLGAPVLALTSLRDLAAEIARHELRAVTDAEDRHPRVVDRGVDVGRVGNVHRGRAARQDDRGRPLREHLRDRHRPRHDLAVHVRLAHPPRDQLRVLRPEVDDEDDVGRAIGRHEMIAMRRPQHRRCEGSSPEQRASARRVSRRAASATIDYAMPMPCARWSDFPSVFSVGATITSAFWNSLTVS